MDPAVVTLEHTEGLEVPSHGTYHTCGGMGKGGGREGERGGGVEGEEGW